MKSAAVITTLLAAASSVFGAPMLRKRQSGISDADILQYALTLEHLEATFYREGLTKFGASAFTGAGFPEWVRLRVTEIGQHEATHVSFLTDGLKAAGASPVAECTYDFSTALASPASFIATAQVLEGVGVAAYLGAAPNVTSKTYLAYAGAVLTVEARHNAWIRGAALPGDSFPEAFEVALSFNQVYTLAAGFIKSCPSSNAALPVKAFPALTASPAGPYAVNQTITLKATNATSNATYAAFIGPIAPTFVALTNGTAKIPTGFGGQTYVVLTSDNSSVSDANTVAGPAIIDIPVPAKDFGIAKASASSSSAAAASSAKASSARASSASASASVPASASASASAITASASSLVESASAAAASATSA